MSKKNGKPNTLEKLRVEALLVKPLPDRKIGKRFLEFQKYPHTFHDTVQDVLTVIHKYEIGNTITVNDSYQGIKLGTKFHRKGDQPDHIFILRRKTEPIAPGSTQYGSKLYLYSKKSNEFIFHYAVPTEFTLVV